jgi:hypothetical protein
VLGQVIDPGWQQLATSCVFARVIDCNVLRCAVLCHKSQQHSRALLCLFCAPCRSLLPGAQPVWLRHLLLRLIQPGVRPVQADLHAALQQRVCTWPGVVPRGPAVLPCGATLHLQPVRGHQRRRQSTRGDVSWCPWWLGPAAAACSARVRGQQQEGHAVGMAQHSNRACRSCRLCCCTA